jgi:NAD(P)-dependent dehydrogenase (short-subunit alcohol dehydrogenase family)
MSTRTPLQGNVALVTGAFGGIGQATALKLAAAGWTVYASGRDLAKSTPLVAQARAAGLQITPIVLDVTDERSVEAAISQIAQEAGQLDVLVNNAGSGFFGAVTESSPTQIRQLFETNVIGMVATSRAALPLMHRNGQGRIINISSVLGRLVLPATGVYAASKFAVEALSDAMRQEFSLLGPQFKVILIEPPFIKTGFADHASAADPNEERASLYGTLNAQAQQYLTTQTEQAPGPEVVAEVVLKAATARKPKARYGVTATVPFLLAMRTLTTDGLFDSIMLTLLGLRKRQMPAIATAPER